MHSLELSRSIWHRSVKGITTVGRRGPGPVQHQLTGFSVVTASMLAPKRAAALLAAGGACNATTMEYPWRRLDSTNQSRLLDLPGGHGGVGRTALRLRHRYHHRRRSLPDPALSIERLEPGLGFQFASVRLRDRLDGGRAAHQPVRPAEHSVVGGGAVLRHFHRHRHGAELHHFRAGALYRRAGGGGGGHSFARTERTRVVEG